ncbi:NAD(P)/FAD-dependent oxidoreductase [Candidatus Omnitrophota bacterium]
MQYVIVGNGATAIAAIQAIRERDKKGKITVISDEPSANYSRPLISYLLAKKVNLDKLPFCPVGFYQENQVELLLNKRVTRLDLKKKAVILADKGSLKFDRLLLATGGAPIIPEIKGKNTKGVFTFTKLADALAIAKYIEANKVKQAVVIGGGLIGLKATEALIERKIKVTIIELADRILASTFDQLASSVIERALAKQGCSLITNNTATEIVSAAGKTKEVVLKDKKRIPANLVIMAIGVRPNVELVQGAAIKVNKGILVDDFMQTNIKSVYAAGDCAEAKDAQSGKSRPLAIWPLACRGGKIAGFNMSGASEKYAGGLAMNSVELCGIPTISVGQTVPTAEHEVLERFAPEKSVYKKIVLMDNRIIGVIFVGEIERAGIYTGLIKDKVDASGFKDSLLSDDFGLVSLPKEYRKHLVGEEVAMI